MRRHRRTRARIPARRGAAMVFALIALLVISMMGVSLGRAAITQHRQRLQDEAQAQAVRLAEAGWRKAQRQISQHADYTGETWQICEDVLGPGLRAEIRIEITSATDAPLQKEIRVVAQYPLGSPLVHRVTHEGTLKTAQKPELKDEG